MTQTTPRAAPSWSEGPSHGSPPPKPREPEAPAGSLQPPLGPPGHPGRRPGLSCACRQRGRQAAGGEGRALQPQPGRAAHLPRGRRAKPAPWLVSGTCASPGSRGRKAGQAGRRPQEARVGPCCAPTGCVGRVRQKRADTHPAPLPSGTEARDFVIGVMTRKILAGKDRFSTEATEAEGKAGS